MKKIFSNIIGLMTIGLAFMACSPEDHNGVNLGQIPATSDYDAKVTVDQEANVAKFELVDLNGNPATGVYPIWTVEAGKTYQTTKQTLVTDKIILAGTYKYSFKVANRNGIADGEKSGTFTINTTRYDFSKFANAVKDKPWRVDAVKPGHMGCGENLANPTNWWKAGPNDKAANTIYDDTFTLTFTSMAGGTYSYDPGENGHTFANKGFTIFPGSDGNNDFDFASQKYEGAFTLGYDAEADQLLINMPAQVLFPYMAGDPQWNDGYVLHVTDWDDTHMTVAFEQPGIAWQLIFISGDDDAVEQDFDPDKVNWCAVDAAENIGAGFNSKGAMSFWWANAGWSQIGDPGFAFNNGVYTITVSENGGGEWQGQCAINEVAMQIEEGAYYDISCKVTASEAIDRMTIKVNKDPDIQNDPNTLFYKGDVKLKKGENLLRFAKRMATDASNGGAPTSFNQAKFIIDLGGAPVGAEVSLSDIIIQKHNPK